MVEDSQARVVSAMREHLPLLLTLAASALAVLRVSSAAGGQPTIQAELLNTLSLQPFLMSVFAPLVPLAIFVGYLLMPTRLPFIKEGGTAAVASDLVGTGAVLICLAVLPLYYAFLAMTAFVALAIYRRSERPRWRGFARRILGLIVLVVVVVVLGTSEVWLPPQSIRLTSEKTTRTAYVLTEDSDYVTLLYDRPREVARVRVSDVAERSFCTLRTRNWITRPPLASRLGSTVDPPACPTD